MRGLSQSWSQDKRSVSYHIGALNVIAVNVIELRMLS